MTILGRLTAFACAATVSSAIAQYGPFGGQFGSQQQPQLPGLPASGPIPQNQQQTTPVQTPTITNVPGRVTTPQAQERQQQPNISDPRLQVPQAPLYTIRQREERNEFQDFIEQSTGRKLQIFGQDLFEGAPSTFAPIENIAVPANYVVGPGDELQIRAWGQIDVDYRAVVDRNGMINIPRVGSISVAGLQYQDLTNHVRSALSRTFRNFEVMVTLGQLRAVQVFVVGYARRPGSYTVSSLSTLVNAIFAAGGPSLSGSMRNVQLKRGNQIVTELDLYSLLLNGDKSKDTSLIPGDVIYFPAIGPLAAVSGSVNHPAIFELRGETSLASLLSYAGGLSTVARSRQITLERISDRKERVVEQVDYSDDVAARSLKDGDVVSVLPILPRFENAVSLRGNVATPLRFPYRPNMRIRDLIPDREILVTTDYYRRQNLAIHAEPKARMDVGYGRRPDGALVSGADGGLAEQQPSVTQAKLMENVRRLSAEINWEYAVIERLNRDDLTTTLIPFNLGKAILENDDVNNLTLMPGDVVTVFSKTDVAAPADRRPVVVSLEGEFNFAGVYQARPKETLKQLIARAGGVTNKAYIFGTNFARESTRKEQEERLKAALDQAEQDLQRASVTRAQTAATPEDAAALRQQLDAQRGLISRLRTLRPTGRIVFELSERPALGDLPDIELEDGDRVVIPQQPSQVSVFGTVFNESSFVYKPNQTVSDYLDLAGGPRKQADKASVYLLRANGSVVSAAQGNFFFRALNSHKPMPGDAIIVPEDFERTTWTKDLRDWSQIFYQFGLGAAAITVLKR